MILNYLGHRSEVASSFGIRINPNDFHCFTGTCGALVLAIFLVIIGWIIKRFKLELRGAINIYTAGILGTALAIGGMLPWNCEQPQLAGVIEASSDGFVFCNLHIVPFLVDNVILFSFFHKL